MKRKVLIVDDEALLARTLTQAFRDAGYDAATAASAEQAEKVLSAQGPFDLLILDIRLPGKSGLELIEGLGAMPETRVVLMTAYDTGETHRKSIDLGVDLYLKKPFDLSMLLSQASMLLEKGAEA